MKNPKGMIIIFDCPKTGVEVEHYLTEEEIQKDIKITPLKTWVQLEDCYACSGDHRIAIKEK